MVTARTNGNRFTKQRGLSCGVDCNGEEYNSKAWQGNELEQSVVTLRGHHTDEDVNFYANIYTLSYISLFKFLAVHLNGKYYRSEAESQEKKYGGAL